jgi:hypothetical protein
MTLLEYTSLHYRSSSFSLLLLEIPYHLSSGRRVLGDIYLVNGEEQRLMGVGIRDVLPW